MKQKERHNPKEKETGTKASYYSDADFDAFDQRPVMQTAAAPVPVPAAANATTGTERKSHKEPDKLYRRNITLSEEQFRRLEFIKKNRNKARDKGEELVTLDKLMFDMVQHCLDTQYPETKAMFEKFMKLKEMEGFGDLI